MCYYVTQQPDVGKIYFYIKDPFESKYQLLIKERDKMGIKYEKNPKAFGVYIQIIDDVY